MLIDNNIIKWTVIESNGVESVDILFGSSNKEKNRHMYK